MDNIIKKFKHYIEVIRRTPLKTLIPMTASRIGSRVSDLFLYRKAVKGGTELTDEKFLRELHIGTKPDRGRLSPDPIIDPGFLDSVFSEAHRKYLLEKITESEKRKIITAADMSCRHVFDLLGSGKADASYNSKPYGLEGHKYTGRVSSEEHGKIIERIYKRIAVLYNELGDDPVIGYNPIDWHRDFISGYRWDSRKWYKHTEYGGTPGADVKVPRELSRCHHLVTMGQAYVLTGEEKYAKEYIFQLTDWIENNEVQFGSNWNCTMDVAIRAANWIISMAYFRNSRYITDDFKFYLFKSLFCHGRHIMANLELSSITSNHFLSDISGLFMISLLFRKNSIGKKWFGYSLSQLKEEINKQVNEDGTDFEASTSYHRLVLELFFYPLVYLSKDADGDSNAGMINIGEKYFGKDFINRVRLMFDFILHAVKPDGTVPQIGDNDSGRFLIFTHGKEDADFRYLLAMAAVYFNDPVFRPDGSCCEEVLWLFGEKGLSVWEGLIEDRSGIINSNGYRDSGYYIMRDDRDYLFISCGPNGQNGNGGHSHNDKLSFELVFDGDTLIVDPGNYIYTPLPELRNRFRSVCSHNTVSVDGKEQNRFINGNLFSLENDTRARTNEWFTGSDYDFLDAEHHGYERLEDPVIHRRQFIYDREKRVWFIKDIFSADDIHDYDFYFQIATGLDVNMDDGTGQADIGKSGFRIIAGNTGGMEARIIKGFYSPGYGKKEENKVIKYSKRIRGNWEQSFILGRDVKQKDIPIYLDKIKYLSNSSRSI